MVTMMQDSQDPMAIQDDTGGQEEADSYTIEIKVDSSGQITVSVESAAMEGQESTGNEAEDESTGQTVSSIKEALALALSVYQNGGKLPTNPAAEQEAAASAFGAARQGR